VGLAPRPTLSDDARRNLILNRKGVMPFGCTAAGIENSIRAAGMEAQVIEDFAQESITVKCLEILDHALDTDRLRQKTETILPAHLILQFDTGSINWSVIDAQNLTFDELDAQDITWSEFDYRETI
jgi:hypothetical protein